MSPSNDHRPGNFEQKLRLSCGAFLWLISTTLTISLFLALAADNTSRQIVLIALAIGLEGAKVLSYRMGKGYRAISISLIAISIMASFGSALMVVETNEATSHQAAKTEVRDSLAFQSAQVELDTLDQQISVDIERLKGLPPNYVAASREISAQIEALRDRRIEAQNVLTRAEAKPVSMHGPVSMFELFAKASGIPESFLTLTVLMFLAVILEVAIIALTQNYPTSQNVEMTMSYDQALQHLGKGDVSHAPNMMSHTGTANTGLGCVGASQETAEQEMACQIAPMGSYAASRDVSGEKDEGMTAERFLLAMADGMPYPTLRGRDATATMLGVSPYRAKLLVSQLAREGKIKAEGKRLVQTGISHSITQFARQDVVPAIT